MHVSTKAIVLSAIKYGDNGLIVKCYTLAEGVKTYLLQGILKSKKGKIHKSQFLPLSLLQINASHNNRGSLNRISEAKIIQPFQSLHVDFVKQSVVFFLSEFLSSVLKEEEGENEVLFDYLENAILWLDCHDNIGNFHLIFMLELTKCLGFYPDNNHQKKGYYFSLQDGKYVTANDYNIIQGEELILFNTALGIKFDELGKTLLSKSQRAKILEIILKYYQLHMTSFKRPNSLDVLSKVLE
ncbi:DNA repair protein RecO [Wenyingzhuangia sp. IMCC45533]